MCGLLRVYKHIPLVIQHTDLSTAKTMVIEGKPSSPEVKQNIDKSMKNLSIEAHNYFNHANNDGLMKYIENCEVILILNKQETVPATALLAADFRTPVVTTPGRVKGYLINMYHMGVVAYSNSKEDIERAISYLLEVGVNPDCRSFDEDYNGRST